MLLQNKAEFIDRCFDTLIQADQEQTDQNRGPYTDFTEKMMTILKSVKQVAALTVAIARIAAAAQVDPSY